MHWHLRGRIFTRGGKSPAPRGRERYDKEKPDPTPAPGQTSPRCIRKFQGERRRRLQKEETSGEELQTGRLYIYYQGELGQREQEGKIYRARAGTSSFWKRNLKANFSS